MTLRVWRMPEVEEDVGTSWVWRSPPTGLPVRVKITENIDEHQKYGYQEYELEIIQGTGLLSRSEFQSFDGAVDNASLRTIVRSTLESLAQLHDLRFEPDYWPWEERDGSMTLRPKRSSSLPTIVVSKARFVMEKDRIEADAIQEFGAVLDGINDQFKVGELL